MKFFKKIWKCIATLYGNDSLYNKISSYPFIYVEESKKNERQQIVVKKEPNPELWKIFRGREKIKCVDVYVHGSWADDTKTPFSDLDDLIIIDREKLIGKQKEIRKIVRWLSRVELRFYRKDVLQHHGHWIIFKDNLKNLDESYIPITVLRGAVLIKGSTIVEYSRDAVKSEAGLKRNVQITTKNILTLIKKYWEDKITDYEMKGLIGSFLLIPAYIFQLRGREISKRDAILNKEDLFSQSSCGLIDKCSKIRRDWDMTMKGAKNFLLIIAARITPHPYLFKILNRKYSSKFLVNRFPRITEQELDIFLKEVDDLCQ